MEEAKSIAPSSEFIGEVGHSLEQERFALWRELSSIFFSKRKPCCYIKDSSGILKSLPTLKYKSLTVTGGGGAQLSSYVRHLLQIGRLHAACAKLVHPQRSLMLQRGAAGVERVRQIIIQKTAEGVHVDVWETTQMSGEVGGVVTRPEDAAKVRVEQVLYHCPAK